MTFDIEVPDTSPVRFTAKSGESTPVTLRENTTVNRTRDEDVGLESALVIDSTAGGSGVLVAVLVGVGVEVLVGVGVAVLVGVAVGFADKEESKHHSTSSPVSPPAASETVSVHTPEKSSPSKTRLKILSQGGKLSQFLQKKEKIRVLCVSRFLEKL